MARVHGFALAVVGALLVLGGSRVAASPIHDAQGPPRITPLTASPRVQPAGERPLGLPAGIQSILLPPLHPERPATERASTKAVLKDGKDPYRLPTSIVPTFYSLFLVVDMDAFQFMGRVEINVNALEATNTIVLHAASNLNFETSDVLVTAVQQGNEATAENFRVVSVTRSGIYETVTITLDKPLEAGGHYMITFDQFSSDLSNELNGFYRSSYVEKGQTRWLATTQFESTHAREAFPCFDEPSFKTRFEISIGHDEKLSVRSNMPGTTTSPSSGDVNEVRATVTTFDTTVPMPTYLLAWVVSDFEKLSNADESFNTWARRDIVAGGELSQKTGQQVLKVLGEYTGIPYALPKTDQFAIPDFAAGAMENWGLVTYREPFLIETAETDIQHVQKIQTIICHELGHQWTGNLVTLDWWSHTWLNEGFATFFENFICDKINPELKIMDKMLMAYTDVAMGKDLIENQHAMSSDVSSPSEISDKFDRISYAKGGSVLRMFQHILTPTVFQKGLQSYLSKNMYKSGTLAKLFRALTSAAAEAPADAPVKNLPAGITFTTVAESWTEQAGVPLVRANWDSTANTLTVTQEQLTANLSVAGNNRWYIPVTVTTSNKTTMAVWLTPDATSVTVPLDADLEWLVVNPGQTGYFRVLYDAATMEALILAMFGNPGAFPAATRIQVLSDATALADAERLAWDIPISLLELLGHEKEASVWLAGVSSLSALQNHLANTDVYAAFLTMVNAFTAEAFNAVGLAVKADDTLDARHMRYFVAPYACQSGNTACLAEATALLKASVDNPEEAKLHPDTAGAVKCYGIRGSAEMFQAFKKLWDESPSKDNANLLACTNDRALVKQLISETVEKAKPNPDAVLALFTALTGSVEHRNLVLEYVKSDWNKIDAVFGDSENTGGDLTSTLVQILNMWIKGIRTDIEYKETQSWVQGTFTARGDYAALTKELDNADRNLDAWFRKHYDTAAAYIYKVTGTSPGPEPGPSTDPTSGTSPSTAAPIPTSPPASTPKPKPNGAASLPCTSTILLAGVALLTILFT